MALSLANRREVPRHLVGWIRPAAVQHPVKGQVFLDEPDVLGVCVANARSEPFTMARASIDCQKKWLGSRFAARLSPSCARRDKVSTL